MSTRARLTLGLLIAALGWGLYIAEAGAQGTQGDETTEPAAPAAKPKPAAPPRKKAAKSADEVNLGDGVDKKRFESYLKERLQKVNEHHKARMNFFAKETETWNLFFNRVRDERRLFEIRITRQTLDLFESLASLDPRDHPLAVGDFERMHQTVVKAFETQQREKMTEFFFARDTRWKDFSAEQERERGEFLAEAQAGWAENRSRIKNPTVAAAEEIDEEKAPKKPRKAAARKPASSDDDDKWH